MSGHKTSIYSQPKGLYLLFSTELWERFGFYTVQAILILYLTKGLGYSDFRANLVYATFSALLYITPMIGGYVADRFLGFQRAIMIGGVLSILGYVVTAFPNENVFFIGLSILISANGLFKPNVSGMVGELYEIGDLRREGGFTVFYMGINVGALIPPLIAGILTIHYGWHFGFLLAAAGMAIGFMIFSLGRDRLNLAGKPPPSSSLSRNNSYKWLFEILFYLGFILITLLCIVAFKFPAVTTHVVEGSTVLIALVVIFYMRQESPAARKKMLASLVLTAISIGFWALYNQTFTSLTLFADRNMQKQILGIPLTASTMQFFNPLYIILLSPFISALWVKLGKKHLNPSIPLKFALGVLFMTCGFFVLPIGIYFFAAHGEVGPQWLMLSYLLQTVGELLISPVGLAMITVLTPKRLVGMMMGVWFFAQAASFSLGGSLANLAAIPEKLTPSSSMPIYYHAFILFGEISLGLTVISLILVPTLRRLIRSKSI